MKAAGKYENCEYLYKQHDARMQDMVAMQIWVPEGNCVYVCKYKFPNKKRMLKEIILDP
jgi:hypothetical protein